MLRQYKWKHSAAKIPRSMDANLEVFQQTLCGDSPDRMVKMEIIEMSGMGFMGIRYNTGDKL